MIADVLENEGVAVLARTGTVRKDSEQVTLMLKSGGGEQGRYLQSQGKSPPGRGNSKFKEQGKQRKGGHDSRSQ